MKLKIWQIDHDHGVIGEDGAFTALHDLPVDDWGDDDFDEDKIETVEFVNLFEVPVWAVVVFVPWVMFARFVDRLAWGFGLMPRFHIRPQMWFAKKNVLVKQIHLPRADFIALNQPPYDRQRIW